MFDDKNLVGVGSNAYMERDGDGYILWVHAKEDERVIGRLINHMLERMKGLIVVRAFWICTPLTLESEGLPLKKRPNTHKIMISHKFQDEEQWLYMQKDLNFPAKLGQKIIITPEGAHKWKLNLYLDTRNIGEARIGIGSEGKGVLRWIAIEHTLRGKGHGKTLLDASLSLLITLGAKSAILYVDRDNFENRNKGPAIRMYLGAGFKEVDKLISYELVKKGASFGLS